LLFDVIEALKGACMRMLIGVLLSWQVAWASPVDRLPAERAADGVGVVLSTYGLAAAGVGLGYAIGDDDCDADDGLICFPSNIIFMTLFGGAGLVMGPSVYDASTDGDGSLLGAWLGFFAGGLVAGPLLAQFTADFWRDEEAGAITTGAILSAVGLGVGYAAFDPLDATPTVIALPDGAGGRQHGLGLTGRF
jgi:hypothetical protein